MAPRAEFRLREVRRVVQLHLGHAAAHEAWCEAKGRCSYCDPLHDVMDAANGKHEGDQVRNDPETEAEVNALRGLPSDIDQ